MTTGLTRGASISFGRSRPLMSRSPCERVGPALRAFPHHFLNHRAPRSSLPLGVPSAPATRRPPHASQGGQDMHVTSLRVFVDRLSEAQRLGFGDLRWLQRDILPNGPQSRDDVEALLARDLALERADRRALGLGRVGGIVLHKPDRLLVGLVVDLAPGLLGKLMGPLARTLVRFSRETGSNSCRNTGHLCCPASSPEEPDAVPQVLRPRLSRAKSIGPCGCRSMTPSRIATRQTVSAIFRI
jgi:hypothetical protein